MTDLIRNNLMFRIQILFTAAAGLLVFVIVCIGFIIVESPGTTRAKRLDKARVDALTQISSDIQSYYSSNKSLPKKLEDILTHKKKTNPEAQLRYIKDPGTKKQYRYITKGDYEYQLCADFELDNRPTDQQDAGALDPYAPAATNPLTSSLLGGFGASQDKNSFHNKGEHCFDYEIPSYYRDDYQSSNTSNSAYNSFWPTTSPTPQQSSSAKDAKRKADVFTLLNAISQYQVDNAGVTPPQITETPKTIGKSSTEADLCAVLVPNYLASLPRDPAIANDTPITDCSLDYYLGYQVSKSGNTITVTSNYAEPPISASR